LNLGKLLLFHSKAQKEALPLFFSSHCIISSFINKKQLGEIYLFLFFFFASTFIPVVLFVCFLLSISAAFEFQLVSEENKNDELCKSNQSQVVEDETMISAVGKVSRLQDNEEALKAARHNESSDNFNEDDSLRRLERSLDNDAIATGINSTNDAVNYSKLGHKTSHNPTDVDHYVNDAQRDNATSRTILKQSHNTCSSVSDFYWHSQKDCW
jgi:hypothetical protein